MNKIKRYITTFFNVNNLKPIELFATVNLVLHDVVEGTFSVFYGQDFTTEAYKYAVYGPVVIKNVRQLRLLPALAHDDEIVQLFANYHQEKSGLTVHDIINSVWVMRSYQVREQ